MPRGPKAALRSRRQSAAVCPFVSPFGPICEMQSWSDKKNHPKGWYIHDVTARTGVASLRKRAPLWRALVCPRLCLWTRAHLLPEKENLSCSTRWLKWKKGGGKKTDRGMTDELTTFLEMNLQGNVVTHIYSIWLLALMTSRFFPRSAQQFTLRPWKSGRKKIIQVTVLPM